MESLELVDPDQLYQLSGEIRRLAESLHKRRNEPAAPWPVTAGWVRAIIRTRKLREQHLGSGLFADPSWDILLDLYASRLEGRRVSVSSLCVASAVPATTALRWIKNLEVRGLITRHADPADGRRMHMEISDDAAARVTKVLRAASPITSAML